MKNRKIFNAAISLLLALLLWNIVSTDEEYDWRIDNVPVVCLNEQEMQSERGLVISSRTNTVDVTFRGKRADLRKLERNKKELFAKVDAKMFNSEREYSMGYTVDYHTTLPDISVEIADRSPKTARFTVEEYATKIIPVEVVFLGECADGYIDGGVTFDVESVEISGPASGVEKAHHAQAILYGNNKVTETIEKSLTLKPVDEKSEELEMLNLKLSENEVNAKLTVLTEKEVPLTIEVIPGGGATEENSTVALSAQTVVLRGEKRTLDAITELSVGELLLGNVAQDEEIIYEVTAPENTELVTQIDEVTASVTFMGLESRNATVSEFTTTHVNKNTDNRLKARVLTQSLELKLRGPAEALAALKDEELVAAADLTDYTTTGEFTVPVTIRTPDETVGAVGEYTVEIVLYTEG